ncbi:MAG TPA: hypothetical protein VMM76_12625 [Pirellulaceae bacterium]|nr:hypothetical protein [Pirellulaceae bacterium]
MSVVINVDDGLARRLQTVAANQNTSVEELAIAILDDAVSKGDEEWGSRNQRRLELIRKSARGELTTHEQAELDQLQNWLDEKFESFDRGLMDQLDEMKQAVAYYGR